MSTLAEPRQQHPAWSATRQGDLLTRPHHQSLQHSLKVSASRRLPGPVLGNHRSACQHVDAGQHHADHQLRAVGTFRRQLATTHRYPEQNYYLSTRTELFCVGRTLVCAVSGRAALS
jgi:hypothetical protein